MALELEGGVDFDYRKRVVDFETLCKSAPLGSITIPVEQFCILTI